MTPQERYDSARAALEDYAYECTELVEESALRKDNDGWVVLARALLERPHAAALLALLDLHKPATETNGFTHCAADCNEPYGDHEPNLWVEWPCPSAEVLLRCVLGPEQ